MAGTDEEASGRVADGSEPLKPQRCLEAFHHLLPSSDGLVRIRRTGVQSLARTMSGVWMISRFAAPQDRSLPVVIARGGRPCPFQGSLQTVRTLGPADNYGCVSSPSVCFNR